MTPNSPQNFYHPEDDLEAYALGALDAAAALAVESHLSHCFHCSRTLAALETAAAALALAVPQERPPARLQAGLMAQLPPVAAAETRRGPATASAGRAGIGNYLLPLAAVLVIGLFAASLLLNFLNANRLNNLQQESAAAAARLNQLESGRAAADTQLEQLAAGTAHADTAIKGLMATNYLMAQQPQPLPLQATSGDSQSEGLLLVTRDGRRAVLMLTNTAREAPARSYRVWLARNGQQVPMGIINVDDSGWGTMPLNPPESLYGFDWVNLTVDEPTLDDNLAGELALQTRIVSPYSR